MSSSCNAALNLYRTAVTAAYPKYVSKQRNLHLENKK